MSKIQALISAHTNGTVDILRMIYRILKTLKEDENLFVACCFHSVKKAPMAIAEVDFTDHDSKELV